MTGRRSAEPFSGSLDPICAERLRRRRRNVVQASRTCRESLRRRRQMVSVRADLNDDRRGVVFCRRKLWAASRKRNHVLGAEILKGSEVTFSISNEQDETKNNF